MDLIIAMTICALLAAAMAVNKQRNPFGWFFVGGFLGLFGIVLLTLQKERTSASAGIKNYFAGGKGNKSKLLLLTCVIALVLCSVGLNVFAEKLAVNNNKPAVAINNKPQNVQTPVKYSPLPTANSKTGSPSTAADKNQSVPATNSTQKNKLDEHWYKETRAGHLIWNPSPTKGETVTWEGDYFSSGDYTFVNGYGKAVWYKDGVFEQSDEGNFSFGKRHGRITQRFADGRVIVSEWSHGERIK